MNNRNDWTPQVVTYLSQFRCASELTRSCGVYQRPSVVVTQPYFGQPGYCPAPVSRNASNGVVALTYPPNKAYQDAWACRVHEWYKRQGVI